MSPPDPRSDEQEQEDEDQEEEENSGDLPPTAVLRRLAGAPIPIQVQSVQIKNGSRTDRSLIEAELDVTSLRNAATLQELVHVAERGKERLRRLGVFDSVRIVIDAGDDVARGCVVVMVDVAGSEWPVCGGFALDSNLEAKTWSLGTSLKLKNTFGFADIFDVSTAYGSYEPTELTAGLTLPRFKSVSIPLGLRVSFCPKDLFSRDSYKNPLTGLSLGLVSTLNHNLQYDLTWRVITDPLRQNPNSLIDRLQNGLLNSVKYSYKIDERDSCVRPRNGYAFLSTSQIGGFLLNDSSSRFFRQEFDLRGAIPFGYLNSSLNLGLSAGLIRPSGKKITDLPPQIPYSFNFSNTSPNSKLGGLSLFSSKSKFSIQNPNYGQNGGDFAVTAFADLSFDVPIEFLKEKGVYFHAFVNAGNIARFRDLGSLGFKRFLDGSRSSAGFGAVLPTKLVRLEVNYCYILKRFEQDKGKNGIQFSFSSP